ncbi:polysaccharide ABC transporter ATP-binding protein [Sphingomonas sp.]|uniref:ABC transporter ATP-binding protein n=1 Tax=Sphingomonas sp. TaxID=28214 RepID=UPI0025D040AB|nr:polysaccharide ABC transporter ATP-binding protein [Sphingomonas sp.]MBV9526812.1 ATP-binding cassette domain-containing protein [Sphingomonas sp.]
MTAPAIEVTDLGKRYRLGAAAATNLREAIGSAFRRRVSGKGSFWALRDTNFTVGEGEIVGLVGNNGAGKSTLLKILSRITPPTEGSVRIRGHVGSLLEVGTGFHPELSGRDNVFMNGLLLGMSRADVRRQFDEIVAFAGVEEFIDLPVKRYSSGMYLRLAFAVAAHLQAEILLIDEVLAVGDVAFQRKCLARMDEVAHEGRTILFVSHNLTAVQALCPRTIWIDKGRVVADGDTRRVLSAYLQSAGESDSPGERLWAEGHGPRSGELELRGARVRAQGGEPSAPIDLRTPIDAEFAIHSAAAAAISGIGVQLINDEGTIVFDVGPPQGLADWSAGTHRLAVTIPGGLLNDGSYRLALHLYRDGEMVLDLPNLLAFEVLDTGEDRDGWYGKWHGVIRPRLDWRHEVDRDG